jgi:hypothetical protein
MPRLGTAMDPAAVGDLAVGTGTHAPPRPRRKKSWLSVFKSKDRLSRGASHDQTAFSARRIVSARRLCRQSAELQTGWRCLGRFDLLVALERTIARKDAALSAAEFKSAKGWKAEDARGSRSRRHIERGLFCSHGCSPRTTPRRTAGRAVARLPKACGQGRRNTGASALVSARNREEIFAEVSICDTIQHTA